MGSYPIPSHPPRAECEKHGMGGAFVPLFSRRAGRVGSMTVARQREQTKPRQDQARPGPASQRGRQGSDKAGCPSAQVAIPQAKSCGRGSRAVSRAVRSDAARALKRRATQRSALPSKVAQKPVAAAWCWRCCTSIPDPWFDPRPVEPALKIRFCITTRPVRPGQTSNLLPLIPETRDAKSAAPIVAGPAPPPSQH